MDNYHTNAIGITQYRLPVRDASKASIPVLVLKTDVMKASVAAPLATYSTTVMLRDIKPISHKRQLAPTQNMLELAMGEWGILLKENPLVKLTLKATDNKRERRLKDGEYDKLIQAARTRQNPYVEKVIIFVIETAMRRGRIRAPIKSFDVLKCDSSVFSYRYSYSSLMVGKISH